MNQDIPVVQAYLGLQIFAPDDSTCLSGTCVGLDDKQRAAVPQHAIPRPFPAGR